MTNGELLNYHNELEGWKQRGSVLALFHRNQINGFYEQYAKRLNIIFDNLKQIDEEFFEYQDGTVKTTLIGNKPVFKKGKTEEQWKARVEKYMNSHFNIVT